MKNHGVINTEYNNQSLDWQDHLGLCDKITYLMCHFNGELQYYHRDIEIDLRAKLWECLQPGKFDPTRGIRVSTYVCRALIREYNRICNLYLGYSPRNKHKHRNVVSLNTPTGEDFELIKMIAGESDDRDGEIDARDLVAVLGDMIGERRTEILLEYYSGYKIVKMSQIQHARRTARRIIEQERQDDPKLFEQIEYAIGVSA